MAKNKKRAQNPFSEPSTKSRFYIMTEQDLQRIDGLINLLDLAITEIFAAKAGYHFPFEHFPTQEKFKNQCYEIIEKDPIFNTEDNPEF